MAYSARGYRGDPPLATWLRARIDAAVDDLLNEDIEQERSGGCSPGGWDPRYARAASALGVEPEQARLASIAFHALPHEVRATYVALVIERVSLWRYIAAGHGPPARARSHVALAERALAFLRGAADPA
jgi:hypothetical protein